MSNIPEIIKQLAELKPKITQDDRMHVAMELGCHTMTIERYLLGRVKKEAFGLELLAALKTRIAEREKALA